MNFLHGKVRFQHKYLSHSTDTLSGLIRPSQFTLFVFNHCKQALYGFLVTSLALINQALIFPLSRSFPIFFQIFSMNCELQQDHSDRVWEFELSLQVDFQLTVPPRSLPGLVNSVCNFSLALNKAIGSLNVSCYQL